MATYLIIALMCGLTAATVALDKGRNPRAWFVAGLLAGPLAMLVVLLTDIPRSLPT